MSLSTILLNLNETKGEIKPVWNMGYNTCHCPLLLRDDLLSQVETAKSLGFRYIRFHNVFSPRVGIYQEDESGNPICNFRNFDRVFDRIIESGMLPFFEISFTPFALRTTDQNLTSYSLNTSIPKSFEKWSNLIKKMISHVVDRYGLERVKQWYFEVWNEPDIGFFEGELSDYLKLYDYTALAVKSVSTELRIGGPATSKCAWIKEFIDHIEKGSEITCFNRVPCDFISTHAYPSDVAFVDSDRGDVTLQTSNIMYGLYKGVRENMNKSSFKDLPLFMGEWNSSAGPLAFNHDERNNAAFIVKTLNELKDIIDGSLYWNLSDIYEECGFHYTPFHGGYGILNVNSIPKSSFNAFKFLNEVKGKELRLEFKNAPEGCGAISSLDESSGNLNILLYYYKEPGSEVAMNWELDIDIQNIRKNEMIYKGYSVNKNSGSPYEWWKGMGSQDYLTLESMQFLMDKSKPQEIEKMLYKDTDTGVIKLTELIEPGDVKLIQILV